jgi:transcriptional regulator with XRE-family HTH domain
MLCRMDEDFAAQIRAARERLGLTQAQVAEKVGVARETVGNWETGQTDPKNKRARLLDVLGLSTPAAEEEAPAVAALTNTLREAFEGLEPAEQEELAALAKAEVLGRRRQIMRERDAAAGPQEPA